MDLKDFLYPYAPIPIWLEKDRKVFVPEVGATGQYSVQEYEEKRREKEMAALMEYNNSLEQQLMRELQIQSTKDLVAEVLVEKGLITPE